ncbi:MAG TPA: hypothetical protein PKW35_21555 [Nannocystaceae bacterium]|nr:hypothetical protein [Nannocystaceae bacterium]
MSATTDIEAGLRIRSVVTHFCVQARLALVLRFKAPVTVRVTVLVQSKVDPERLLSDWTLVALEATQGYTPGPLFCVQARLVLVLRFKALVNVKVTVLVQSIESPASGLAIGAKVEVNDWALVALEGVVEIEVEPLAGACLRGVEADEEVDSVVGHVDTRDEDDGLGRRAGEVREVIGGFGEDGYLGGVVVAHRGLSSLVEVIRADVDVRRGPSACQACVGECRGARIAAWGRGLPEAARSPSAASMTPTRIPASRLLTVSGTDQLTARVTQPARARVGQPDPNRADLAA